MSQKRLSQSLTGSWKDLSQWMAPITVADDDSEDWLTSWKTVFARNLVDSRIVSVDAAISVEDACDVLFSEDIPCLAVKAEVVDPIAPSPYHGLFDFADVNAFLTLAATRHTLLPDDLRGNSRMNDIVVAAKAGRVPVHLVSNLSEKNPIEVLPHDATLVSLLEVFSRGIHRALIQTLDNPREFMGIVSDDGVLAWFASYARRTPSFQSYLSNPIQALALPSLDLHDAVVASKSSATVLDAMKLMSEQGVSSIAVLEEKSGTLMSAVSVTDIGKIVAPSQSNQILATPLHQFISHIKERDGSKDGADKYPVYSVFPSSLLSFTMEKLIATNSHRVFVTRESDLGSPIMSGSSYGNLTGVVSIVDILSLFARVAKIPNVDPTSMSRHRRASSASSLSDRDFLGRSRSGSRASVRHSPSILASSPPGPGISILELARGGGSAPIPVPGQDPLSFQKRESRRSANLNLRKDT